MGSNRNFAMWYVTSMDVCWNFQLGVNGVMGIRSWGEFGFVVFVAVALRLHDIMSKQIA